MTFTGTKIDFLTGKVFKTIDRKLFDAERAVVHQIDLLRANNPLPYQLNFTVYQERKEGEKWTWERSAYLNKWIMEADNPDKSYIFTLMPKDAEKEPTTLVQMRDLIDPDDEKIFNKYAAGISSHDLTADCQLVSEEWAVPQGHPIIVELYHQGGEIAKKLKAQKEGKAMLSLTTGPHYHLEPAEFEQGKALALQRLAKSPEVDFGHFKIVAEPALPDAQKEDEIKKLQTEGDTKKCQVVLMVEMYARPIKPEAQKKKKEEKKSKKEKKKVEKSAAEEVKQTACRALRHRHKEDKSGSESSKKKSSSSSSEAESSGKSAAESGSGHSSAEKSGSSSE